MYKLSTKSLINLPEKLLLFLIVLAGGSVYYVHPKIQLPLHFLIFLYASVLLLSRNHRIDAELFSTFVIVQLFWILLLGFYYIKPSEGQKIRQYVYFYVKIYSVSLLLLIYANKTMSIINHLYGIFRFLLFHALANFFLSFFIAGKLFQFTEQIWTYLGIFYYIESGWKKFSIAGISFWRNQGLFWEPGVLQIYMNLLLFLALFLKRDKFIAILSMVAILSTWSTTGLMLMLLQLSYWIVTRGRYKLVLILHLVLLLSAPIVIIIKENIEEKISGDRAVSTALRILDFQTSIKIVKENPLSGIGIDFDNYAKKIIKHQNATGIIKRLTLTRVGDTNSFITLFVYFGMPIALLLMYFFYKQTIFRKKILFFIIMMVTSMAEPLLFTLFFFLFFVSGQFDLFYKIKCKMALNI